jgi:hypothetical protein
MEIYGESFSRIGSSIRKLGLTRKGFGLDAIMKYNEMPSRNNKNSRYRTG